LIAFGCAIASEGKYRRCALPSIERSRERHAPLVELRDQDCLFKAYNRILDEVSSDPRIEALVLMHEDTEIRDRDFDAKVRRVLIDPDVAVVGAIGARGVNGIDWWNCHTGVGACTHLVFTDDESERTMGETEVTGFMQEGEVLGPGGAGQVDAVDGFLLVLSNWAIRKLRFDESLGPGFHGYDADICFQARDAGRKVWVAKIDAAHHRGFTLDPRVDGPVRSAEWRRAHMAFRRKWESRGLIKLPPWSPRVAGA
jgi:hypothetical protein